MHRLFMDLDEEVRSKECVFRRMVPVLDGPAGFEQRAVSGAKLKRAS